jgi:hypothetical protein
VEPNPYLAPAEIQRDSVAARSEVQTWEILRTKTRRVALVLFSLPFLLALPVRYWAFHVAGDWFVDIDIDSDERIMHLRLS